MKNFLKIVLTITILFCVNTNKIFSQSRDGFPEFENVEKVAQTGYQFLKINPGARGAAMGGAVVTLEGDATTVFWNPAGITSIEERSVFVGYTSWFADMQHLAFSAAINLGDYGIVGINAVNMDYGDIKGTAISNSELGYDDTGNLDVKELAIGLTYGRKFSDRFGVGLTIKYVSQDLIARNSSVIAFDIGTIYNTLWNDVKIAVSIQHFSGQLKYIDENFELPLTFRVGISMNALGLTDIPSEIHKLTVALEGVNPRDFSERIHIGSEYVFRKMFALRAGYKFNYDLESFSFGAGLMYSGIQVDYSYSDFGSIFGSINRISLVLNF